MDCSLGQVQVFLLDQVLKGQKPQMLDLSVSGSKATRLVQMTVWRETKTPLFETDQSHLLALVLKRQTQVHRFRTLISTQDP